MVWNEADRKERKNITNIAVGKKGARMGGIMWKLQLEFGMLEREEGFRVYKQCT